MESINTFEHMHKEHQVWKVSLLRCEKQVKSMKGELGNFVRKKLSERELARLEHIQNNLTLQKDVINETLQLVTINDKTISRTTRPNNIVSINLQMEHGKLREDMVIFDKLFNQTKGEFDLLKHSVSRLAQSV